MLNRFPGTSFDVDERDGSYFLCELQASLVQLIEGIHKSADLSCKRQVSLDTQRILSDVID